ncbi:MAG: hypothetical protein KKB20_16340 [Proteobacteria bacterium]|nr:hypothetical protein [Pseudomonadota bacterium]
MADITKKPKIKDLSPEAARLVFDKQVSGRRRLKDWRRLLGDVAAFDEAADRLRSSSRTWGYTLLVLSFILSIGTAIVAGAVSDGDLPEWLLYILMPAIPVSIGLTVFLLIRAWRLKRVDMANDFRVSLVPFLEAMAEDIEPRAKIQMELNTAGPVLNKLTSKQEVPPGRFKRVVETVYSDPWLSMEAPLAGGSRLMLHIENTYQSQDRYWKNSSGKSKHKCKWKKWVTVTAGLAPNPDLLSFETMETSRPAEGEKIKLRERTSGQKAASTRKFKFKSVNEVPEEAVTVEDLIGMFLGLAAKLKDNRAGGVAP